jgi:hypothetical protein
LVKLVLPSLPAKKNAWKLGILKPAIGWFARRVVPRSVVVALAAWPFRTTVAVVVMYELDRQSDLVREMDTDAELGKFR